MILSTSRHEWARHAGPPERTVQWSRRIIAQRCPRHRRGSSSHPKNQSSHASLKARANSMQHFHVPCSSIHSAQAPGGDTSPCPASGHLHQLRRSEPVDRERSVVIPLRWMTRHRGRSTYIVIPGANSEIISGRGEGDRGDGVGGGVRDLDVFLHRSVLPQGSRRRSAKERHSQLRPEFVNEREKGKTMGGTTEVRAGQGAAAPTTDSRRSLPDA